jgi:hypothetical protein
MFKFLSKRIVVFSTIFVGVLSADEPAAKQDPFAPFLPKREPGEVDPFAQTPVPKIEDEQPRKGHVPEIDPSLDYLFRLDDDATPEEREHFKNLSPEAVDRLRTHYLERLNTEIGSEIWAADTMVILMTRKLRQWDDAGVEYNRDEMIESILKCIKTEALRRIANGMLSLKGLRDDRVHAYISSFLGHELEVVRKTAELILPTTDPKGATKKDEDPANILNESSSSITPKDELEKTRENGKSTNWFLIGLFATIGVVALVWTLSGRKENG